MRDITSFDWTETAVDYVRTQHDAGASYTTIGMHLGITRHAVIGKVHRLKLALRGKVKRKPRPPHTPRAYKPKQQWSPKPMSTPLKPVFRDLAPDQSDCAVTLADLQSHHCRWPLGDPRAGNLMFCGDRKLDGYSYCPRHCDIAYTGGPKYSAVRSELVECL